MDFPNKIVHAVVFIMLKNNIRNRKENPYHMGCLFHIKAQAQKNLFFR